MQLVWFKRDLRIADHAPLSQAAQAGRCVCLYVYEPELITSPEFDASHLDFINEALAELDTNLRSLGSWLTFRRGRMPDVLDDLHREFGIDAIWSHIETGNKITFDRDKRVLAWARKQGVRWNEISQNGVVRGLSSRDGWSKHWNVWMSGSTATHPTAVTGDSRVPAGCPSTAADFELSTEKTELQVGGESQAGEVLGSFLEQRGENYRHGMSSPVTAWQSCSRLSPYLAWGCISMKSVVQQLKRRQVRVRDEKSRGSDVGSWLQSLSSFQSRLSWHCHFMQKLEDEPAIEFENMSRAYDGLREDEFNQAHFDAWCEGRTGYPMVDACMRALRQHSWINFRMRAMLVSFASYHLWLHWRPTATFLARHFLDFEPGIHYSQIQMQSGTTGINSVRIYSPIKQVVDQDPGGEFLRRYLPELAAVPDEHLAEPHKMSLAEQGKSGCKIGRNYPRPVVEHAAAYRAARARISAIRRQTGARSEAKSVYQKHGSRRSPGMRRRSKGG